MSTCQPSGDPVAAHAGALGDVLVGPAADRERMVAEFRDGLADATDAYVLEGLPRAEAARRAVREAGTVAQLAPHFQRELTVAQARHTARAAALSAPLLTACWALARPVVGAAAVPLAVLACLSALLAVLTLAATGGALARRLPALPALPRLVARAGTAASAGMAVATAALVVTACVTGAWALVLPAGALSAASHAVVGASVRVCRRCLVPPAALPGSG